MSFHVPDKWRVTNGRLASTSKNGNNGAFLIPPSLARKRNYQMFAIASDGFGWEHVSVSLEDKTPSWDEMCFVKSVFWDESDCVLQFHPPQENYVNNHKDCLHLWRPIGVDVQLPESILVGIK